MGEVAGGQWGVIGWRQFRACGLSASTAWRWRLSGRLHVIHHGVYSVGHRSIPIEGRLVAALLYAGDGAVLSHATAAWWWGLIDKEPDVIDVSTALWTRSCEAVRVHRRRRLRQTRHRRFPVTTIAQTMLDYAANSELIDVRRALAAADYRRLLDPAAIHAVLGQGRPGTAILRRALERHEPRLARARSRMEVLFIPLCERAGIPLPEVNVPLHGWTVDGLWHAERLVVELDGAGNHSTVGQLRRDRQEELELRSAGFVVIRYSWDQVIRQPDLVAADILDRLAERRTQLGLSSTAPLA